MSDAGTEVTMTNPTADKNYYYKTFSRTDMYTLNAYLNWHQTFAEKHNLAAMIGTQYNLKEYDYTPVKASKCLLNLYLKVSLMFTPETFNLLSPPNSQYQFGAPQVPQA